MPPMPILDRHSESLFVGFSVEGFSTSSERSVYGLRTDDKKLPDMSRFARCGRGVHSVAREANGSVERVVKLVGTRGGFQTGRTCGTGARLVFRYPSASSRAPPVAPFVQRHRGPPRETPGVPCGRLENPP